MYPDDDDLTHQRSLEAMFARADQLIDNGFDVLPAWVWPADDGTLRKAPAAIHGHLDATHDRQFIRQQLAAPYRPPSVDHDAELVIGFVPGSAGMGVLDCDTKHGAPGRRTYHQLLAEHGDHWVTALWRTPSGGGNILFRKPAGEWSNTSPWPGIDVRVDRGWVVAPGNTTPWGDWRWQTGGPGTASDLPEAMAAQLKPAEHHQPRASNAETVAFIDAHTAWTVDRPDGRPGTRSLFDEKLNEFRRAGVGNRHPAMVSIVGWLVGTEHVNLADGLNQIQDVFMDLMESDAERHARRDEVLEMAAWAVSQEKHKPPWTPGTPSSDPLAPAILPERFWERPNHARVRQAALTVGVSPEALMLAVLASVAAHIPPAITYPGKRLGVPNLLVCVIGPPGKGKGTTIDRALELVPLPAHTHGYRPGTAQGLVKEFYETAPDDPDDPASRKTLRRHRHPVFLRVDEIAKFSAAANRAASDRGEALLGELKQAVFGETLGQSVATDDKRLQCEARTYRLTGVLGVAPSREAATLFADTLGGFPQRLLFANLLRPDQQPTDDPGPFDDMTLDEPETDSGTYDVLRPLVWHPPPRAVTRFADSTTVAQRIDQLTGADWELLDAHIPYLAHMVAAVLCYWDGRWVIQPADLTLAEDILDMSRHARTELGAFLDRQAAAEAGRRRAAQVATAVATRAAVAEVDLADEAKTLIAAARQFEAEKGRRPSPRDLNRHARDRARWYRAWSEVERQGWGHVETEATEAGGSPRKVIYVDNGAP